MNVERDTLFEYRVGANCEGSFMIDIHLNMYEILQNNKKSISQTTTVFFFYLNNLSSLWRNEGKRCSGKSDEKRIFCWT